MTGSPSIRIGLYGRAGCGKTALQMALAGPRPAGADSIPRNGGMSSSQINLSVEIVEEEHSVLCETGHAATGPVPVVGRFPVVAVLVIDPLEGFGEQEEGILRNLEKVSVPVLGVISKSDLVAPNGQLGSFLRQCGLAVIEVSARTGAGLDQLRTALAVMMKRSPGGAASTESKARGTEQETIR